MIDASSFWILALLGVGAGAINSAVGSGSLLTLPILLAVGLPPGTAVRTNTMGMLFSTIGSTLGFRREIREQQAHLGPLTVAAIIGAISGSLLLLVSPSSALDVVVPVLIVLALVLVVAQKPLTRMIANRRAASPHADRTDPGDEPRAATATDSRRSGGAIRAAVMRHPLRAPALVVLIALASVYGGYFTAAQGIIYMAILAACTGWSMPEVNPVKNWLSLLVNAAAVSVYLGAHLLVGAPIAWLGVLAIGIGSLVGGFAGAQAAKRLPDPVLRGVIVVVALIALFRAIT